MTNIELTEILDRYTCIQCEILKAQVIKAMVEAIESEVYKALYKAVYKATDITASNKDI